MNFKFPKLTSALICLLFCYALPVAAQSAEDCDPDDDDDDLISLQAPAANLMPQQTPLMSAQGEAVLFSYGSAELKNNALPLLNAFAEKLKQDPSIKAEIAGHTDDNNRSNRPQLNTTLSKQRADNVKKYLVSRGIAAKRLTTVGYGPSQPVTDNATVEDQAQNRRVELRIHP
ncbi:MAG: OmpA family protein [Sterolibacterium sp.]|nr:OmpA family protein [Sterolibacterium sp.]